MPTILAGLGIPEGCIENSRHGKENGRSIYFKAPTEWTIKKYESMAAGSRI